MSSTIPCRHGVRLELCPLAKGEVHALLIEPAGVVNTGDAEGALTAGYDDSLL
jgi:hypothetical protein